jgi:cytochrome c oxidase cbb3-type subunit 1
MVEMTSTTTVARPLAVAKARVEPVADTDTVWARLVFSYLAWATAWLLFGTLVGEYLGIKFVIPDIDHVPWLSFGRLRPVHTNTVFWGWSSLSMIGMTLYVVPKTSRRKLFSFRLAYVSLALINLSVFVGSLLLMSGINNGGQEYREYIWPVQAVFAVGVSLIAYNLIRTIAARDLEEIYISNWYIMGGLLWTIALLVIAYLPWYQQNGISETVIQGFYITWAWACGSPRSCSDSPITRCRGCSTSPSTHTRSESWRSGRRWFSTR